MGFMVKIRLKKGDQVLVITGKEKGKRGRIITVYPKESMVTIEGLHLVKKHRRPRRAGQKGEIVLLPRPVNIAKVQLVCPKCSQPTRVARKSVENRHARICKKCESEI
jgi:large subunit ribosomal protein L24